VISINFRSDIERTMRALGADAEHLPVATYRALNRTTDKAATETSREIRRVYNVRDRAVKSAMKKLRAHRSRLYSALDIEGARIPLIEFDAKWRRGQKIGATVRIKIGEGRKAIPGAFIAKGRVYKRIGKSRYPIRVLRGVSVPQAASSKAVRDVIETRSLEEFMKVLEQNLRHLSSGD
jgi:hypothetical protein